MMVAIPGLLEAQDYVRERIPPLMTWEELREIGEKDPMPPELAKKASVIKTTAFLSNEAWLNGSRPHRPNLPRLGPGIRAVLWNIERGLTLDTLKLMYADRKAFLEKADLKNAGQEADLADQIEHLRAADLLILNELDWGMKRTQYREVVREFAAALGMNWAYAVEFFEVDPVNLGTEKFRDGEVDESKKLQEMLSVDKARFHGMHGSAVLSRYPIREARAVPFKLQAYDWYGQEVKRVAGIEKGRRLASEKIFLETILREIRRGGRTTLYVTIDVPDLKEKQVTIVAPHLENRSKPERRRDQMREILAQVKSIRHPVIIAGDMNTSMSDAAPTSIKREIYKRVGSAEFWATTGLKWATGLGLTYDIVTAGVNKAKNLNDPTAKHVPVVAPNPEALLFDELEKFRFDDGGAFDFRGDRTIARGKAGTLANSNERAEKGFAPTYAVAKTYGPVGQFKLDWFFIKGDAGGSYRFAPHFPRTLRELNYSYHDRLSDHNPMTVDLPFEAPKN